MSELTNPNDEIQNDETDIIITCCNNLPIKITWDLKNVNFSSSYDILDDTTPYNEIAKDHLVRTIQLLKYHNKDHEFLEKLLQGWVLAQTTNRYEDLERKFEDLYTEEILNEDHMWKSQPTPMVFSLVAFFIEKLTDKMNKLSQRDWTHDDGSTAFIEFELVELYKYILKDVGDDQGLKQKIQEYNKLTTPIQDNDCPVTTKAKPKEYAIKTTSEFKEIIRSLTQLTDYWKRNLRKAELKVQSIEKQCVEAETAKKNAHAVEEEFDREFKSAVRFDIGKSPSIKQNLRF